jgi:hypothetical protein
VRHTDGSPSHASERGRLSSRTSSPTLSTGESHLEVALVLVALIYNEVDKPEPISPLLLAHFANMDDCVGAAKLAQVPAGPFPPAAFQSAQFVCVPVKPQKP